MKTMKKVLKYLGKYRALLALSVVLTVISVLLTLYVPILLGQAFDTILGKGQVDFPALLRILTTAAILAGVTAVLQWITGSLNNKVTFGTGRDLRVAAFEKIQRLPLKYLDRHPVGEIVSRVISDTDTFADGLLMGFTQLTSGIVTILATLGFMLYLNRIIALAVIVLTPLSLLAAKFIAGRTHDLFVRQAESKAKQTAFLEETVGGEKVIKAFNREKKAVEVFRELNDTLAEHSLKATFFSSLTNPVTRFVNSVVYAAVALLGGLAALAGTVTVGGLTCFLSYANQYTKPFNEISGVITEVQNALTCAERVFSLIEETPETADENGVLPDVTGRVALDYVSFSYVPERPLIQNLSVAVEPGQRVAIVGPTGCGKTTLINLLMRFYDVNDGAVRIEQTDIRSVPRADVRRHYGMVLQETWLKAGTIRENIAFAKPDATMEEIEAAAKAAHAHGFIRRMKDGYDTVIGEDGGSLSQGQKQLLCIARVMLALPPMLILDEATSSIDIRTEQKIQAAFTELMRGRTSFVVAHRLSTIKNADRILVMNAGSVIEQGTHEELLAVKGFYYRLYNSQFEQEETI